METPHLLRSDLEIYDKYIVTYIKIDWKKLRLLDKRHLKTLVILMDDVDTSSFSNHTGNNTAFRRFTDQAIPFSSKFYSNISSYDVVENIYQELNKRKRIPRHFLVKVYQDSQIDLCFKKFIISSVRDLFILDKLLMEIYEYNSYVNLEFYPNSRINKIISWLNLINSTNLIVNIKKTPTFNERYTSTKNIFIRLKWASKILFMPVYIIGKLRHFDFKNNKKVKLKIILHTFNTDWGLSNSLGTPTIDWPIKENISSGCSSLFVSDSHISESRKKQFNQGEYKFLDLSKFKRMNSIFLLEMLYSSTMSIPYFFIDITRGDTELLEISTKGMYVFYQWTLFLNYYRADNFLCYQGASIKDVFRNIILKKNNCVVWKYDHTFGFNYNININTADRSISDVNLAYLNYTNEIHWGCLNTNGFINAMSHTENHLTVKPIWGYIFRNLSSKYIFDEIICLPHLSEKIIVSIFNSSFAPGAFSDKNKHLNFLIALNDLLETDLIKNNDIIFLIKGKYPLRKYHELNDKDLSYNIDKILTSNKIIEVENKISSTAIIKISSIVISMAYTSTCVEALMMGKKAIYFDWNVSYPDSAFQKFENLVASNSTELFVFFKYWLEMKDSDFIEYINTKFVPFYQGEYELVNDPFLSLKENN